MKPFSLVKILSPLLVLPVICCSSNTAKTDDPKEDIPQEWRKPVPFKNLLGVNAFEWDFLESPDHKHPKNQIFEPRMANIMAFGGIRHYLDWEKLEPEEGEYTFNPSRNGNWYYDVMYERCKKDSIAVLACIKQCPPWLVNTYPENMRNAENVPAPYGLDRTDPASYVAQAKMAFQFAARYGYNTNIDPELVSVSEKARWTGDDVNQKKTGLQLIKYIECDNERDKWWRGKQAEQSPEEYAANMSAFYDGHKGALGKNAGVKTADPNMLVVMGGLAKANVDYVRRMVNWCKANRGTKPDGSVDLCFDVINYHLYSNDAGSQQHGQSSHGMSPENSAAAQTADDFIRFAHEEANASPVWITEAGYDIHPKSPLRALAIGKKTAILTQADWLIRSSLLYARHGIERVFYFMLDDVNTTDATQFSSSGFVFNERRRPSADYFMQAKKVLGDFTYKNTISQNPLVDVYESGNKTIYVLTLATQNDKSINYTLDLAGAQSAEKLELQPGSADMKKTQVKTAQGKLQVSVSETPVFIRKN
ncbi:MAG: beta-galactosidase [Mucilaginibacter polytrichastri]|nr:beta-galactosidase [Mucilaginibacter polytrichastri]